MALFKKVKNGNKTKIYFCGVKIISYGRKTKNKHLENVFKKENARKVLISYIDTPFNQGFHKKHTNPMECYAAALIFDKLGFNVDVVQYSDTIDLNLLQDYSVIYGFGKSFNLALMNPNINTIHYGTGCCTNYSNIVTVKKCREFYYKTKKFAVESHRFADADATLLIQFSKTIIALGNDFVANTYKNDSIKQNIKNLNCFYYDIYDIDLDAKNFNQNKINFLWFGSAGTLHKGLDICIDIFKKRQDINLTICGASPKEKVFFEYYHDVFRGDYSNIQYKTFVDIESDEFRKLMDETVAVITPSVSEGGAPATLNVMANGGLIPIISTSSGLDVGHYGFMFDDISESSVEKLIDKFLALSAEELKNLSQAVKDETRKIYSYENYSKNLEKIITDSIKEE